VKPGGLGGERVGASEGEPEWWPRSWSSLAGLAGRWPLVAGLVWRAWRAWRF
jgi:hypothetical protein